MIKVCRNCERIYRGEEDFLIATSRWRMGENALLYFNCSCDSTQVLPPGRYEWYRPEKFLKPAAREVFNRLALGEMIPSIPASVVALQQKINDVSTSVEDIALLVRQEPILAADLLKLSNSFKHDTAARISSIEHAIMFVGRRMLADLIMTASLRKLDFRTRLFRKDIFWREAFATGMIAEFLFRKLSLRGTADAAYIAGCLANVGKVIGAICFPEVTDAIYEKVIQRQITWVAAEKMLGVPSHAVLGEIACCFWGLPDFVAGACHHHSLEADDEDETMALVVVANQLMHKVLGEESRMDMPLLKRASATIGYAEADLTRDISELRLLMDFE